MRRGRRAGGQYDLTTAVSAGDGLAVCSSNERTQSRIGGTLWEKADAVSRTLLILRRPDRNAGAHPAQRRRRLKNSRYQGIEFFVALRRLGKPAWLINYNGDPRGNGTANKRTSSAGCSSFRLLPVGCSDAESGCSEAFRQGRRIRRGFEPGEWGEKRGEDDVSSLSVVVPGKRLPHRCNLQSPPKVIIPLLGCHHLPDRCLPRAINI